MGVDLQQLLVIIGLVLSNSGFCDGWWFLSNRRQHCFQDPPIGCFPLSSPFDNSAGFPPQSPAVVNMQFYLHDSFFRRHQFTLDTAETTIRRKFDPTANVCVLIHGYMESVQMSSWMRETVRELRRKNPQPNVVVADWSGGSINPNYFQAVANSRVAGAVIALFLEKLIAEGWAPSRLHLIGMSLGAHVAGHVGSRVEGLGRITGLDPAGPAHENVPPEARLDPTDALFVDVIHTDADPRNPLKLGTMQPMGSVDFYPNRARSQPGCPNTISERFRHFMSMSNLRGIVVCSHARAAKLFAASINNECSFPMWACTSASSIAEDSCQPCSSGSCPPMGFHLNQTNFRQFGQGFRIFNMETYGSWPYC